MVIIFMGAIIYFMGVICRYLHDDYKQYPNIYVGYKVSSAMKNKETWDEANAYIYKPCKISFIFSIVLIGLTNLLSLKLPSVIYYIAIVLILCGPIVSTEFHLYKFNKNMDANN